MLENPNFEQNQYSITSSGFYKFAHDCIRILKWICYYDRSYYGNINYYDLMGSIVKYSNRIFVYAIVQGYNYSHNCMYTPV